MNIPVKFYLNVEDKLSSPRISIKVNDVVIIPCVDLLNVDHNNNVVVSFDAKFLDYNTLQILVENNTKKIEIVEIYIDDICLLFATFLATTNIKNYHTTSIIGNGCLTLKVETPVWKWWCETINSFSPHNVP